MSNGFLNKFAIVVAMTVAGFAAAIVGGVAQPASATSCVAGSKYTDFTGSASGTDTLTVATKGGKKLCSDVRMNFTSYKILNTYNGKGFKNNPTALPQAQFYNQTIVLKKGTDGKATVKVQVPDACTDYQIDAYIGPVQSTITTNEGLVNTNAIASKLFQRTKSDCTEPPVDACNTVTGIVEKVAKGKENVAPYTSDLAKCKVTACNLQTMLVEYNVSKSKIDDIHYTLDLKKCQPKEDKKITVCRLSDKVYPVTIKESEFDSTKYSKDPRDCKKIDEKMIKVCRLSDKEYPVTIKESDFDSAKYSTDASDCDEPETPKELPRTGPAETLASLFGAGALAGTVTTYVRSRNARS